MGKKLIVIAGIPASGKTFYGKYITEKYMLPFICKDYIKGELYDVIHYDTSTRDMPQLYGVASSMLLIHVSECLMKVDANFAIEGNFTSKDADKLNALITKYAYQAMTILFYGNTQILHKRFWERNESGERHPGLRYTSKDPALQSYEMFEKQVLLCREFVSVK